MRNKPPQLAGEKNKWFLEISFLVKSDYSNDSQPQPFLCPFFFLVTKAWRFCGEMGIYLGTDMTTLKGFLWQLNRHLMSGISNQHNQRFATVRSQVGKSKSFLPYKALACFRLYFTRSLSPNIFSFLSLCFATLFSSVSFPTTTKSWWVSYFCQDCRSKESDKSGSQTIHKNVCLNFYIVYLHKPNFLWNLLPPTILEIRMMYVF